MSQVINFPAQEISYRFSQTISEQDVANLLSAVDSADLDEFAKLLGNFDLNQVYDYEEFPEPQLLSKFLLLRFLGFIDGDEHFPNGFPNAAEFIEIVLATKPDLTFYLDDGYSFVDFIKDRCEILVELIIDLRTHPENNSGYIPSSVLLQSYEGELLLIELIIQYLSR
jgi:hypothetical protein